MNTAKPTKICAAPAAVRIDRRHFRAERRPADHHARHLDVVERPARERDRPRHPRRCCPGACPRSRTGSPPFPFGMRFSATLMGPAVFDAPVTVSVMAPATVAAHRQPADRHYADRQIRRPAPRWRDSPAATAGSPSPSTSPPRPRSASAARLAPPSATRNAAPFVTAPKRSDVLSSARVRAGALLREWEQP